MAIQNGGSRRQALQMMLAAAHCLRGALAGADTVSPVRLAISESLVTDVNINDARAAMIIWLQRMIVDLNVPIELNPKVFDTTEEILRRARGGLLDAVALNIVEYRQIADVLDSSQVMAETGPRGEQYLLLLKRSSGMQHLADLRGRRLAVLRAPKMCVASAWVSSILDAGHLGGSDQFFSSVTLDSKISRVVLPVFFGQTDACLTSKTSFDIMTELNPQVGKDLAVIATSPEMVVTFQIFHKNFSGVTRERFAKVYSSVRSDAAGRQLATLFQFQELEIKDANCLAPALRILESVERVRGKAGAGHKE
jgi:ABC-type phosphate/phosphonate transport system substrate-binding protein